MYKFPSRSLEPKVIAQPSADRRERAFRSDYAKQLLAKSVLAGCVLKRKQWSLEHVFNGSLDGVIFDSQVTWLCEFRF